MGIDLAVLPNRYYDAPNLGDGYNRLGFWRDYELFEKIRALPSRRLEPEREFAYYGDEGIENTHTDEYGKLLEYVEARQFVGIHSDNQWNEAILIFLQSLPLKMPVVLYWY